MSGTTWSVGASIPLWLLLVVTAVSVGGYSGGYSGCSGGCTLVYQCRHCKKVTVVVGMYKDGYGGYSSGCKPVCECEHPIVITAGGCSGVSWWLQRWSPPGLPMKASMGVTACGYSGGYTCGYSG